MSSQFTIPPRPLTWLITGCSSGLGLSIARLVQSHGHTLIATSRAPARTPDLVTEVESKGGKWLRLDVEDILSSKHVIEGLEKTGQHIDILINNAGTSIHAPVETLSEEEVRRQMELLYFGPARLIRAVLPYMRKRRFGALVNMSSGAALEGRESMGAYAAAKAALDAMSKVLAKEVAPFNIRALTVSLGAFNTNMTNALHVGKNPMPHDYEGSVAEQVIQTLSGGKFAPDGDKDKAMQAVYEVVMGEGVGKGREGERFLPLGRDLAVRVKQIQDSMAQSMEVFGDICNDVYVDQK